MEDKLTEKEASLILKQAKEQQEEFDRESKRELLDAIFKKAAASKPHQYETLKPHDVTLTSALCCRRGDACNLVSDSEDDEHEDKVEDETDEASEYEAELEELTDADRALFERFSRPTTETGLSLSETILKKLSATFSSIDSKEPIKEPSSSSRSSTQEASTASLLDNAKVVEVYTRLGELLSRYKAGKLPKAFKVLPVLRDWQAILALTQPASWTPHAVYQGTRLFSSILNSGLTQRYYAAILLPHVRQDLAQHKKLNYHLYLALKKSLYKPAAFFKGILLPLCLEDGAVSLKEASILASVLAKASIPVLHAAAAILQLTQLSFTGAILIFLRTLLDKKYTLPYAVIDALVLYFVAFINESRPLFVLWHQALLVFVQRYKMELTTVQRDQLVHLVACKSHPTISSLVLQELEHSVCRQDSALLS